MTTTPTPRILVVDDDLGVVAAYRHVLEREDDDGLAANSEAARALEDELFGNRIGGADMEWRTHFVDQGEDAVAAVRAAIKEGDPFSVIFLDVRMPPGLDGYETAKQIRSIDKDAHIVFVSAFSDYEEHELIEVAGPQYKMSLLPKPVWPDELKSAALAHCREAMLLSLLKRAHRSRFTKAKTGTSS